jgi:hypothetical protein
MKVLIISANSLPAAPTGPAYIAGATLEAGHDVEIFDYFLSEDPIAELLEMLNRSQPDVIGVSIRNVTTDILDDRAEFNTKLLDMRPIVKEMIDSARVLSFV